MPGGGHDGQPHPRPAAFGRVVRRHHRHVDDARRRHQANGSRYRWIGIGHVHARTGRRADARHEAAAVDGDGSELIELMSRRNRRLEGGGIRLRLEPGSHRRQADPGARLQARRVERPAVGSDGPETEGSMHQRQPPAARADEADRARRREGRDLCRRLRHAGRRSIGRWHEPSGEERAGFGLGRSRQRTDIGLDRSAIQRRSRLAAHD